MLRSKKSSISPPPQNQNNWASETCGVLTLHVWLCSTCWGRRQTMRLFKSAAPGQRRWKWFLYSLCPSRNNNGQSDFEVSRNHLTNRGIVLSPLVLFSVSLLIHIVLSSAPIAPSFLSARAGLDGHVGVNLEHWVPGFILVKHSQRRHLFWDTTGLRDARDDPNSSDYALDSGVVRWPCNLREIELRRVIQRQKSLKGENKTL